MLILKLLYKYIFTILVLAGVIYLSFASPSDFKEPPITFEGMDKILHMVMYVFLGGVLTFNFSDLYINKKNLFYLITLLFPILLGGVIEIIQMKYIEGRSGEWLDWLSDIIGVVSGYLIVLYFIKRKEKTKPVKL